MPYRPDEDLAFLGKLKSKELNELVSCLMRDKGGDLRLTEELSTNES